jgi:hypothetical protein
MKFKHLIIFAVMTLSLSSCNQKKENTANQELLKDDLK